MWSFSLFTWCFLVFSFPHKATIKYSYFSLFIVKSRLEGQIIFILKILKDKWSSFVLETNTRSMAFRFLSSFFLCFSYSRSCPLWKSFFEFMNPFLKSCFKTVLKGKFIWMITFHFPLFLIKIISWWNENIWRLSHDMICTISAQLCMLKSFSIKFCILNLLNAILLGMQSGKCVHLHMGSGIGWK